jgi:hypothetical protein
MAKATASLGGKSLVSMIGAGQRGEDGAESKGHSADCELAVGARHRNTKGRRVDLRSPLQLQAFGVHRNVRCIRFGPGTR